MIDHYKVLEQNFNILQIEWPKAILDTSIDEQDNIATDGMAAEAKFKIIFIHNGLYMSTVYVNSAGDWFSTMDNVVVKKTMKSWTQALLNTR